MSEFIKTDIQPPKTGELKAWITEKLKTYGATLLAFADDGVIWGHLQDGKLATAPDAPELREETLQQALIFGADCEVRLFREETTFDENGIEQPGKWKALRVVDGDDPRRVIVESQVLWGNKVKDPPQDGFFYAEEYRAGVPGQWLPVERAFDADECARLEVHHLVEVDKETGEARIALSRLAGLSIGERAMEVEK